ncbi:glycoside hydrolase family 30 beta sandwich domain-containing protein [Paenibacillus wynnii]
MVPGTYRIQSNTSNDLKNVAFTNPDGSKVVVAYNPQTSARSHDL